MWTEPNGERSFYRVQWTNGTTNWMVNVSERKINVTELTAGVKYTVTVIAVAGDNKTESDTAETFHYTKPKLVRNLSVIDVSTSSVALNWTAPEGNSSFYRVQWTSGNVSGTNTVSETSVTISNLTAGVQYTITVTAVAYDGVTDGQSSTVHRYTKPEVVWNLTVSEFTTSSIYVMWTEPNGERSFYRVQWTNGTTNWMVNVSERKINVTELTAGVKYTVTVIAVAGDNKTESDTAETFHYTKPKLVRNLTVTDVNTSSVSVNWTAPEGNSSFYRVQWTGGNVSGTNTVSQTPVTISNLTAGVQYTINVTAVAYDGVTDGQSSTVQRYTKPEVVWNLTVSEFTTSSIYVMWTEPNGERSFYRVQWTNGTTNWMVNVSDTKINVTELTAGVKYTVTVIAVAGDNKTESDTAETFHYTKPKLVRNLTVTDVNTSSVSVNWTAPEGNSSFYRVQWTGGNVSGTNTVSQTPVTISNLTAGVQYTITVTAVAYDGVTDGQSSTVQRYTKPEVVWNLTVSEFTTSSIYVMWTEPNGERSFYRVQWTNGTTNWMVNVSERKINVTELTAGVKYTVTVIAVAGDNKTESDTAETFHYTKPKLVRNLTVTDVNTSSVSVNWTAPEGNSSFYRVQWTSGNVSGTNTVSQTPVTISNLTAGVQYTITVTAVAYDGVTDGQSSTVQRYTKPGIIGEPTVSQTTSSISLNWTSPPGQVFMYRLEWHNGGALMSRYTEQTFAELSELISGTNYTVTVTAVAGDNQTEGRPYTFTSVTKPKLVRNLTVTDVNTSSVSVNWTAPEGNSSFYRVQWTGGNVSGTNTVSQTPVTISNLTAGVQYTITVTAVAYDGVTDGQSSTVQRYTKPEVVWNLTVSEFTTSSIYVMWTEPNGERSFYRVQWTNGTTNWMVNVSERKINVTELTAGVKYTVTVIAVAGDNKTESDTAETFHYTKPKLVRNLTVTDVNTSSVSVNWTAPEGNSSFYRVQWTGGNVSGTNTVSQTPVTISNLTAGVQYTITVTAVAYDGVTDGQSSTVQRYTKPGIIGEPTVSQTTSSISLDWTSPPGQVFMYRLEWHNGGALMSRYTEQTFAELSQLISGTKYTVTVTAVAGDNQTEGRPFTFTSTTKPEVVRNLTVTNVSTSSVSVNWTAPDGHSSFYRVQWTGGSVSGTNSVFQPSVTISNLTAGVQYTINVTAVADDDITEGQSSTVQQYTRPEKPVNIVIISRGTDNLNISWTLSQGKADRYEVNISNSPLMYFNITETVATTALFPNLYPGRIYVITVTAKAGPLSDKSEPFSFATKPTPPGSIIIGDKTNSSLPLGWAIPVLMEGATDFSYHINYQPVDGSLQNKSSTVNNTELSQLSSGTSYKITIETVGPQNLRSTAVQTSAFTLPNPVLNLVASPFSTTSVQVNWSDPLGVQQNYSYLVKATTYNASEITVNTTANSANVPDLEPGTRYNISVRTIAAPGAESEDKHTFSYTMPKAVTNLTTTSNTTAIQLTWSQQSDYKTSYSYLVQAFQDTIEVQRNQTATESYTFFGLNPGELYTLYVFTVVEGVKSTEETKKTHTRPEVVSNITAIGDTTNMSVSWDPAIGRVAAYTVWLYRDGQLVANKNLSNTTVNTVFQHLKPGVLYCVEVVTKSGPFESNSSMICNATFPNPPGPITVMSQTVKSINFTWPRPEDMDQNLYSFSLSNISCSFLIKNNWSLFDNLQSGSLYNISVVTVGVRNYTSTAVTAQSYTRPYSVTELREAEITTNAVTLVWQQPESKPFYSYVVQFVNGSLVLREKVLNGTITGLLSGSNYSFTVTTETADGTQAAPVTVSFFTRPYSVTSLHAETRNTTTVNLTWTKPLEYKDGYTYRVQTTSCGFQNTSVSNEVAQISELSPGTSCSFCVFVRAANGIEGEANCTSQYTKPETVQPSLSSQGSNSSMLVSWTKPPGKVENYKVVLNNNSSSLEQELNSTSTYFLFESLSAGMLYTVTVTTYSGPFSASSKLITNATFPNPPGVIEVLTRTTSSIKIRWDEAPLMTGASFHYRLTNTPSQGLGYNSTTDTSHTFDSLLSGTSYNISVSTIGVMDFESEKVYKWLVTTRPLSVPSVVAHAAREDNITVTWENPADYKESYYYNLTWQSKNGPLSILTKGTEDIIYNLDPGSRYSFNVTTVTSDGTQGATTSNSSCTNASPVNNLKCEGPNTPDAKIILSWTKPSGQHSDFLIAVNNSKIENNTCCNRTVSNLHHFTAYRLTVQTRSCGQPSTPVSLDCWTGITAPPIPPNYESLLVVTSKEYNKFSIQVDRELLNGTNGPVTHVGVLVTNNAPGDSSTLAQYLNKTYDQWKAKATPVYLATVTQTSLQSRNTIIYLSIDVGSGSTWGGYLNGPLEATGKYQCAIVLFTSMTVQEGLVNGQLSLVTITKFYAVIELPQNPAVISIAIGATLGIFCVLFIILIGFIIYWKRLSKKETSDIQIHSMRAKVSVPVRIEDYEAYYKKQKADSNCGFAEEFEDLKVVGTGQSKTSALTLENKPKNRYNNVLPYDSSRVKLSIIHGSPYDDYINANYMPGYNSRKEFIAAQGPLPTTVNEFWRMIWEKNVQTLVMLTRCNEQGRVKCEQYWSSGTKHFENITVTTASEIPLEDWTIRDFDIKNVKTAETRSVRHFHFTAWPDHGVPETTELLISFRHLVREHMDQYSRNSPTVVHCSAGVGRTGTFIAIDRLIFQIERENTVDVYGIVHDLRMHRPLMVQTEDQYVFLNQCAMDIIRSRTGTNVDLIYQNTAALSIYENIEPKKGFRKNGYHNA
ncbi:receptor-type tyrosine-protein phosphatase eta isoform X2 [Toxotes jaculatrix]|uniref:receptor-type tyrosine-protein phosphatase eta isoform X2 n=1 Tax=Toxotes jaculatrix TaxID=941984 RepID=UPI001B3AC82F|nr:receptor-type tyrosine-protein phosphatase eta isoform X2 [Toxotes jaculatrix]